MHTSKADLTPPSAANKSRKMQSGKPQDMGPLSVALFLRHWDARHQHRSWGQWEHSHPVGTPGGEQRIAFAAVPNLVRLNSGEDRTNRDYLDSWTGSGKEGGEESQEKAQKSSATIRGRAIIHDVSQKKRTIREKGQGRLTKMRELSSPMVGPNEPSRLMFEQNSRPGLEQDAVRP
ncbi:uncharacterized protein BJX67DRAFT_18249 [Aspergillus lucknowensis]|uniref:Uncharacterized protein n=1 Tax=Aspergillus lucknowensis TaxID=176173 RepID=A0ABR4M859_9EURO